MTQVRGASTLKTRPLIISRHISTFFNIFEEIWTYFPLNWKFMLLYAWGNVFVREKIGTKLTNMKNEFGMEFRVFDWKWKLINWGKFMDQNFSPHPSNYHIIVFKSHAKCQQLLSCVFSHLCEWKFPERQWVKNTVEKRRKTSLIARKVFFSSKSFRVESRVVLIWRNEMKNERNFSDETPKKLI